MSLTVLVTDIVIQQFFKVTSEKVVSTAETTTTEEVGTVTPRQVTPSVCEWKNFVYAPGYFIKTRSLEKVLT